MALAKVLTVAERRLAALQLEMDIRTRNTAGAVARYAATSVLDPYNQIHERNRRLEHANSVPNYTVSVANMANETLITYSHPPIPYGYYQLMPTEWQVQGPTAVAETSVVEMPEMSSISTVPIAVSDEDLQDAGKQLAMEAEAVLGYTKLRKTAKAPSRLRCVLAKLEIEVLNPKEVKKYKAQVSDHFRTSKKMYDPTWNVSKLSEYKGEIPEFVIAKAIEVKKELPNAEFFVEHFQEDPFLIVTTNEAVAKLTGRHSQMGQKAIDEAEDTMYLEVWNEKSFESQHK